MREVVGVLSRLGAPYYLSEGSLLYLYRDCGLGQSDLDLVLDLAWWNKTNSQALQMALAAKGFSRPRVMGKLEEVGYEESHSKDDIKVSICPRILYLYQYKVAQVYRLTSSLPLARNTTRREQFAQLVSG